MANNLRKVHCYSNFVIYSSRRLSYRNVRREIYILIACVRSDWNGSGPRLLLDTSLLGIKATRGVEIKRRWPKQLHQAHEPLSAACDDYGYWPSLANRPVSCAPRRWCDILLRGQKETTHVDEAQVRPAKIDQWNQRSLRILWNERASIPIWLKLEEKEQ